MSKVGFIGPVMGDIEGTRLQPSERERLQHPLHGGLILFARNYKDPATLAELTQAIRAERPDLLLAVDTEGGRVQRFREGFTVLPALARYGQLYESDPESALQLAVDGGRVLGAELAAFDIDLPFSPVLDLDGGVSAIIGDRAFHAKPEVVAQLAFAHMQGLRASGVATTGKHFPGHGWVAPDSHEELPVDKRLRATIEAEDLMPYHKTASLLDSVMVAHVVYPDVDSRPASFSKVWLTQILRAEMNYQGAVFADDLSMGGAAGEGDIVARAKGTFSAGCDMLPVCNKPEELDYLLTHWQCAEPERGHSRLQPLRRRTTGEAHAGDEVLGAYQRLHQAGLIENDAPPAAMEFAWT